MIKKRRFWMRLLLAAAVMALFGFLFVRYLLPLTQLLTQDSGRAAVMARIESFGIFAPLVFSGLMALQIVIAFIPGGPLELIAGMLFGSVKGILFSMLGAAAGTGIVCLLVKFFGRPLVHFFVPEQTMERFSVLQDEKKLEFWVFLLFLIPGIPKDLLTYFVPLTKMPPLRFLFLSTLARLPAVAVSVCMGDSLTEGRYWLTIVIVCIAVLAAVIGLHLRSHILKKEEGTL